ncbi:MAG: pantetheine-phosphate adenylyltransferase [Nitrospinota bacterium]|nr:pantetheine-phosphate adenylyltransferase [Nitrospinota bacterium]
MKSAVYPGTFDPVTNGHLDLITRALGVFDRVVVAVAKNPKKNPVFDVNERVMLLKEVTKGIGNVEVVAFDTLTTQFCQELGLNLLIRGLRAVSDFEYELQMNQMNRKLNESIETVFMMPGQEYTYISSGLIKEVASYGGDVSCLVPPVVSKALKEKFK